MCSIICGSFLFKMLFLWFCDYLIWTAYYFLPNSKRIEVLITNEWAFCTCIIICDFLGIIFKYIFERTSDTKDETDPNKEKQKIFESLKLIIFTSFLSFLFRTVDFLYLIINQKNIIQIGENYVISFEFFFRFMIFRFANPKKPKNLDNLVLIIMTIIGIFFLLFFFFYGHISKDNIYYRIIVNLKIAIVPIEDVINNYLLEEKKLHHSYLMLARGIFNSSLMAILTLFLSLFGFLNIKILFDNNYLIEIVSLIGFFIITVIFTSLKYYNILLVLKKFTAIPAHFCYTFLFFIKYLERRSQEENSKFIFEDFLNVIFFLVINFIILVYSNIIPSKIFISEKKEDSNVKAVDDSSSEYEDDKKNEDFLIN